MDLDECNESLLNSMEGRTVCGSVKEMINREEIATRIIKWDYYTRSIMKCEPPFCNLSVSDACKDVNCALWFLPPTPTFVYPSQV